MFGSFSHGSSRFPLRQKQYQTFAGASGFKKLRHSKRVDIKTTIHELRIKLRTQLGQYYLISKNDRVTGEMLRLLRNHLDQIANLIANRLLPILIECSRVPDRRIS